jgi:hypothetical protein
MMENKQLPYGTQVKITDGAIIKHPQDIGKIGEVRDTQQYSDGIYEYWIMLDPDVWDCDWFTADELELEGIS